MPFADRPHPSARLVHVDNLKSLLVAWIIGCHALLGYTVIGGWPYDEVTEVTLSPPVELVSTLVLGPTALFVIGAFFFLSGLFAPLEILDRGPGGIPPQPLSAARSAVAGVHAADLAVPHVAGLSSGGPPALILGGVPRSAAVP